MILIKNGKVIDFKNKIEEVLDILIDGDKIIKIEKNILADCQVIDAEGKWVCPGLVDLHVHGRDPGQTYKEDLVSVSNSAAKGGVTSICVMPNTSPVIDSPFIVEYIKLKSEKYCKVNVLPISAVTKGQAGKVIVNFEEMKEKGAIAVSEDGKTVEDSKICKEAMELATKHNLVTMAHCEDLVLKNNGHINESKKAVEMGIDGINNESETVIVARDIQLAQKDNLKLHICHTSTKESVLAIKEGKIHNKNLTAEVAPHHFVLTDEDVIDGNFKMSPPLRSKEDVRILIEALKSGVIDCIATDHAPHADFEKNKEIEKCANGIVGLETLVPLTLKLIHSGDLTPLQFVEKTSYNPAKIIGLEKGVIEVGYCADIVIIDPDVEYKIDVNSFVSKSKNSPFHNYDVKGRVEMTIVGGEVVYDFKN